MHHIPSYFITACTPMIRINGFVTFNSDVDKTIFVGGKFFVEVCGSDNEFLIFLESACSLFDNGKCHRQNFIQSILNSLMYFFFEFIYFFIHFFALAIVDFRIFDFLAKLFHSLLIVFYSFRNDIAKFLCFCTQFVIAQIF